MVCSRAERQGQIRHRGRRHLQLRRDWVYDGHHLRRHGGYDLGWLKQGKASIAWQPRVGNGDTRRQCPRLDYPPLHHLGYTVPPRQLVHRVRPPSYLAYRNYRQWLDY